MIVTRWVRLDDNGFDECFCLQGRVEIFFSQISNAVIQEMIVYRPQVAPRIAIRCSWNSMVIPSDGWNAIVTSC